MHQNDTESTEIPGNLGAFRVALVIISDQRVRPTFLPRAGGDLKTA